MNRNEWRLKSMLALLAAVTAGQASTDYGPAIWRPACDGKWNVSGNGHKFCVIHDMEGYYAYEVSAGGGLRSCGNSVSIHYCVNGKQDASSDYPAGEVTQEVRESYYAWHARCWNSHSFGTEHEGFRSNPAWFTDAMYNSSAALQRHLCDRWSIAKDRNHIVGHDAKSSSAWVNYAGSNLGVDGTCNTHNDPGPYWDWSKFMGLINGSNERIDCFTRGPNNGLYQLWSGNGGNSWGWVALGGALASDPAAVSWGANVIHVFARSTTNTLIYTSWNGGPSWANWINLGNTLVGAPDVASWGSGRLDVFARSTSNTLLHNSWNGTSWYGWQTHGAPPGGMASDPAAVSNNPERIHIFCRGTDNAVWYTYWSGTAWAAWTSIGGTIVGAPDVASSSPGKLEVFGRGTDNAIWMKSWNGSAWSGWSSLGGTVHSDPGAVSPGDGRLEVFAAVQLDSTTRSVYRKARAASGTWGAWENLGGNIVGSPDPASWTGH